MTAWIRDRRGSIDLIEFVLILPIFILLIYGFFGIWKIVSVKQSLDAGTYQAARCLSVYFHDGRDDARRMCEYVLWTEVKNNSFITEEYLDGLDLDEHVKYYDGDGYGIEKQDLARRIHCNDIFSIKASLPLPWAIFIPGLRSNDPNSIPTPTFVITHTSYIECGPTRTTTP